MRNKIIDSITLDSLPRNAKQIIYAGGVVKRFTVGAINYICKPLEFQNIEQYEDSLQNIKELGFKGYTAGSIARNIIRQKRGVTNKGANRFSMYEFFKPWRRGGLIGCSRGEYNGAIYQVDIRGAYSSALIKDLPCGYHFTKSNNINDIKWHSLCEVITDNYQEDIDEIYQDKQYISGCNLNDDPLKRYDRIHSYTFNDVVSFKDEIILLQAYRKEMTKQNKLYLANFCKQICNSIWGNLILNPFKKVNGEYKSKYMTYKVIEIRDLRGSVPLMFLSKELAIIEDKDKEEPLEKLLIPGYITGYTVSNIIRHRLETILKAVEETGGTTISYNTDGVLFVAGDIPPSETFKEQIGDEIGALSLDYIGEYCKVFANNNYIAKDIEDNLVAKHAGFETTSDMLKTFKFKFEK